MDNNLPELRDIHLPPDVSAFPPAYGWWMILGLLIAVIIAVKVGRHLYKYSRYRFALKLLNNSLGPNVVETAQKMSVILRRICVYKYKNATILQGRAWINFLNEHCKTKLEDKSADLLCNAPYIKKNTNLYTQQDLEKLQKFCKVWIGENL